MPTQPLPPACNTSPFLNLPLELRHQIYHTLFHAAGTLTLRSLFIRAHYINKFMTQQPKTLSPQFLRVCRQILTEAGPILYSLPRWMAACRLDALRVQIGTTNFAGIRWLSVDVDDLVGVVEGVEKGGFPGLEVLEVDGFQACAVTSLGSHRVRVEALRLCCLAVRLVEAGHNGLKGLLQGVGGGVGGADARDLTMGRVKWTFVRDVSRVNGQVVVDLCLLRMVLEVVVREDELVRERGRLGGARLEPGASLPVAWTSSPTARFALYPFLRAV